VPDYLSKKGFNLLVNILSGETEFLVEHLVRSRETEALESPNSTVGTYKTFEVDRQTCGQTELLLASGEHALLILLALAAEQALRRNAYDACLDTIGSQQLSTSLEGRNLRT
jgi:hypothetical protein